MDFIHDYIRLLARFSVDKDIEFSGKKKGKLTNEYPLLKKN